MLRERVLPVPLFHGLDRAEEPLLRSEHHSALHHPVPSGHVYVLCAARLRREDLSGHHSSAEFHRVPADRGGEYSEEV